MAATFTSSTARRWAALTRSALANYRGDIDALNVFPVPDADTGTNLYLTLDRAVEAVVASEAADGPPSSLAEECRRLEAALRSSARGNSGMIVSQIIGGLCRYVIERDLDELDASGMAAALRAGAIQAAAAVHVPADGTILTVADAAADAAQTAADAGASLVGVLDATVDAAQAALAKTPSQLPVLAEAGVVDAGGAGLLLLFEALAASVPDSTEGAPMRLAGSLRRPRPEWHPDTQRGAAATAGHPRGLDGVRSPAFEVVYEVEPVVADAAAQLRRLLGALGDSVVVTQGDGPLAAHAHVNDPAAAVDAALAVGAPHSVRITPLTPEPGAGADAGDIALIVCSAGPGVSAAVTEVGGVAIESSSQAPASAGALLDAVLNAGTRRAVLVANDEDSALAAAGAARAAADEGRAVRVIRAGSTLAALAACAVFEPDTDLDAVEAAMVSACAGVRQGAVTIARSSALTLAGPCAKGDVLGIVQGDVTLIGSDPAAVADAVVAELVSPRAELLTVVAGRDRLDLARSVREKAEGAFPGLDGLVLDGGIAGYELLIGVE